MIQIVDKLNEIAKAIDESVELPDTGLITDSLDAITKAFGGTPTESGLIVDKLADIAGVAHGGITPTGKITITENATDIDIRQYATADVSVSGIQVPEIAVHVDMTALSYGITIEYYYLSNNIVCLNPEKELNGSTSHDLTPIAFGLEDTPMVYAAYLGGLASGGTYTVTASAAVNCSYINGYVVVTDITLPSSITLTVTIS